MINLTFQDFFIADGKRGKILCNKVKGICLVMFFSPGCGYCKHFLPSFANLSKSLNGCLFGIVNVNNNRQVVAMSRNTIIPITYVPYIILYVDGKPFMRYDGPKDENEIKRFVIEVTRKFSIQNKFASQKPIPNQKIQMEGNATIDATNQNEIPAYTLGIPKTGGAKQVCYFNYEDAYGSGPSNGQNQGGQSNTKFSNPSMGSKANGTCYHCYDDAYGKK